MTTTTRAPGRGTVMVTGSLVLRLDQSAVRVVVVHGGKERAVQLQDGHEVVVGSGDDAALHVEDPTVSRAHCKIAFAKGEVRVTDLGSTNGTFFETARLKDAVLQVGSSIKLGLVTVRIEPQEAALSSSLSSNKSAAPPRFGKMIGADVRMREMFALLGEVASTTATVIVEGEPGTGKELVARALHEASPRKEGPFVAIDCTAVPKDVLDSALFADKTGAFARADTGTLFIDELGELPLELQPKLLRVLENKRLPGTDGGEGEAVDVRVVCATNRDLKGEVRSGRFREDLFYRLAVVKVQLPPLRERPDDVEALARHFAEQSAQGGKPRALAGLAEVKRYAFPGNVRELHSLVERALSMSKDDPVDLSRFLPVDDDGAPTPPSGTPSGRKLAVHAAVDTALDQGRSFKDAKGLVVEAFERAFLQAIVEKTGGNLSRAAALAQMDRKHMRDLLRRMGLWSGPEDAPER